MEHGLHLDGVGELGGLESRNPFRKSAGRTRIPVRHLFQEGFFNDSHEYILYSFGDFVK
jgi:hypothetical protein